MQLLYCDYAIHTSMVKHNAEDAWKMSVRYFLRELGMDPDYAELLEYEEILYDGKPARAYRLFKFPFFIVFGPPKSFTGEGVLHYRAEFSGETSMWVKNLKMLRVKKYIGRW